MSFETLELFCFNFIECSFIPRRWCNTHCTMFKKQYL